MPSLSALRMRFRPSESVVNMLRRQQDLEANSPLILAHSLMELLMPQSRCITAGLSTTRGECPSTPQRPASSRLLKSTFGVPGARPPPMPSLLVLLLCRCMQFCTHCLRFRSQVRVVYRSCAIGIGSTNFAVYHPHLSSWNNRCQREWRLGSRAFHC